MEILKKIVYDAILSDDVNTMRTALDILDTHYYETDLDASEYMDYDKLRVMLTGAILLAHDDTDYVDIINKVGK